MRVARKKGIGNPRELTLNKVLDGLRFCRLQMAEARERATPGRDDMMKMILADALDKGDKRKVSEVKGIMNGEKSKQIW